LLGNTNTVRLAAAFTLDNNGVVMDTTIAVAAGIAVVFIYLILLLAKARRKRSLNRISSKWEL